MDENRQTPGAVARRNGMEERGKMFVDVGVVNVGSLEASSENRMAARGKTRAQQRNHCAPSAAGAWVVLVLVLVRVSLPLLPPPKAQPLPVGAVPSAGCQ